MDYRDSLRGADGSNIPWIISQLTKREIRSRYKGSVLGFAWALLVPIATLFVYTFVFGTIFKGRWHGEAANAVELAALILAGLAPFSFISECVMRAPQLVVGNAVLVKKVIFPLNCLVWVSAFSSLFQFGCSLLILLVASIWIHAGSVPWTWVFFPINIVILLLLGVGLSWCIAALGVFLRDINQIVGIMMNFLLFLTPIFYPLDAVPQKIRVLFMLNPMSILAETSRDILIIGRVPDLRMLAALFVVSAVFAVAGHAVFQKARRGFADVL
jgi:lipopolysaccharide transport system permease protein